jgi:hypothetical protein
MSRHHEDRLSFRNGAWPVIKQGFELWNGYGSNSNASNILGVAEWAYKVCRICYRKYREVKNTFKYGCADGCGQCRQSSTRSSSGPTSPPSGNTINQTTHIYSGGKNYNGYIYGRCTLPISHIFEFYAIDHVQTEQRVSGQSHPKVRSDCPGGRLRWR